MTHSRYEKAYFFFYFSISFYRIIVEETSTAASYRISKRGVEDAIRDVRLDFKGAKERDVRAYIAAQLPRDHPYRTFVVGDNNTYEGYYNAPLEPRREYSIWYGAYTVLDGVSIFYFFFTVFTELWFHEFFLAHNWKLFKLTCFFSFCRERWLGWYGFFLSNYFFT